jgi:hypothetical protein
MSGTQWKPGERRVIDHSGWRHTQIRQADGSWWNITVERIARDGQAVPAHV